MDIKKYDDETNEFEIQAQLYVLLKGLGFNVKGEHTIMSREHSGMRARLDIVVFNEHNIATHIIECKSPLAMFTNKSNAINQVEAYKLMFGLPVILCYNVNQFTDIINTLSE